MMEKKETDNNIDFVTAQKILPDYFLGIRERLQKLSSQSNGVLQFRPGKDEQFLGGGTDLYVQQHEHMLQTGIHFLFNSQPLKVSLPER